SATLGAGKAQLFLSASPDTTTGRGVYAATVTDGSGVLLDSVRTVVDASHVGFVFTPPQALTAGTYQLTVTDFQKPAPLAGLGGGIAVQHGAIVSVDGNPVTVNAQAGPVSLVVFADTPAAGAAGLFNVQLGSAGTVTYQTTQAVGAAFINRTVHV